VPHTRLSRSLRVTFIGLAANTLLTLGKFIAGVVGHSHALVADAVESLADIFSSLIVWRGVVVAAPRLTKIIPMAMAKPNRLRQL
jgi:divalent metal cation (Fe/Co/Zn/Cd) transporter